MTVSHTPSDQRRRERGTENLRPAVLAVPTANPPPSVLLGGWNVIGDDAEVVDVVDGIPKLNDIDCCC